jgi:formylglycine-generating enzyme required for sulfatase activity
MKLHVGHIVLSGAALLASGCTVRDTSMNPSPADHGMEFVSLEPGEFVRGLDDGAYREQPAHRVRISRAFELGTHEVTQAQWEAVMGHNPSEFRGAGRPVERISWHEAQEFIEKLNARQDGYVYRLPTEAEWEYASRAGADEKEDAARLEAVAWCGEAAGGHTHPVGTKEPNAWGLHDMQGNVWEWVEDWFGPYPAGEVSDPRGPASGEARVFRGGSWAHGYPSLCRSGYRNLAAPDKRYAVVGLRLARTAGSPASPGGSPRAGGELEFVPIPAGRFLMGRADGDGREFPVHDVRITRPFELGKYEVTQAQWQAVMGTDPAAFKGADRPVEQVTWEEVQQFMQKLNERDDGFHYRLPTEAEWEYACRAGTTGDYAGDLDSMAWYHNNSGGETHPVGLKAPNAWGLHDMHGNLFEWVQDRYGPYSAGTAVDPGGPPAGEQRVRRGGSFAHDALRNRCSRRYRDRQDYPRDDIGFRVVRTPAE